MSASGRAEQLVRIERERTYSPRREAAIVANDVLRDVHAAQCAIEHARVV